MAQAVGTPPAAAWTELTGQGAEVRAAAGTGGCPTAVIDGRAAAMAVRSTVGDAFPQVCSLALPTGAAAIEVEGRVLPAPTPPRRIVILGDTGCRIKGLTVQACNDPKAWP